MSMKSYYLWSFGLILGASFGGIAYVLTYYAYPPIDPFRSFLYSLLFSLPVAALLFVIFKKTLEVPLDSHKEMRKGVMLGFIP